jgi:hypothetical protein
LFNYTFSFILINIISDLSNRFHCKSVVSKSSKKVENTISPYERETEDDNIFSLN